MASDYVDDLLRAERESFKLKEAAAKKFDNRLDNFRKSAKALRDAARQLEKAFPGMKPDGHRRQVGDDRYGEERSVRREGRSHRRPAGRKSAASEPENDAVTETAATEADTQTADDGTAPQDEPAAEQELFDDGRPAWASDNY